MFAGEGIKPAPRPTSAAPRGEGSVRIAVVTHGQASSTFWSTVRNGVDAAASQMNVSVSYQSPDAFSVDAHARADRRGGRQQARRPRRLDPRPRRRPGDPARGALRDPGRLDELGLGPVARSSASSRTSASPRSPPGAAPASGWRRPGVRNAICINQEVGNKALDMRCAAFAKAMRATAGARRCSRSTSRTATWPRPSSPPRSRSARPTACSRSTRAARRRRSTPRSSAAARRA